MPIRDARLVHRPVVVRRGRVVARVGGVAVAVRVRRSRPGEADHRVVPAIGAVVLAVV